MDQRNEPDDGSPYTDAVPQLARSTLWPSAIVALVGGLALLIWGTTWLTLGRPLGWALVGLGVVSIAAIGRLIWKAVRGGRGRSR